MTISIWLLLLGFTLLQNVESRSQEITSPDLFAELSETEENLADISCTARTCLKRSDDMGPFWANRGKKDSKYLQQHYRYKEPRSYQIRNQFRPEFNEFPFVSEWRKPTGDFTAENNFWKLFNDMMRVRDRRIAPKRLDIDSPFFAARGKKFYKI